MVRESSATHTDGNATTKPLRDIGKSTALLVGTTLLALAWTVYRPEKALPFHIVDFAEFIPLLEGGNGIVDRAASLVEYYARQGRLNVIPYALLAAKWDLFSWWSPGWQMARASLMAVLFLLTYFLMRRLGASRLGSLFGGSVFLCAPSASDGWVHLTMAEPLGAAIALIMSIRATRYQTTAYWRWEAGLLAASATALVLTKELVAPILLLPVLVALTFQRDGKFAAPEPTRRNMVLIAAVLGGAAAASVPVVAVFLRADTSAYASLYGRGVQSMSGLLAVWITSLFPFDVIVSQASGVWLLAFVSFFILVFAGWRIGLRSSIERTNARWLLGVSLVLPFVGVMAYLPAPWFARFYALPYLLGAAILTGFGTTYLQSVSPFGTVVAGLCSLAMATYSLTSAIGLARRSEGVRYRDDRLVAFVADSSTADTVVFATVLPPRGEWVGEESPTGAPRGLGATYRRFATATHRRWPSTREASCDAARNFLRASSHVEVVNLDASCDLGNAISHHITEHFVRFDPRTLRFVRDSTEARVFRPGRSLPAR